MTLEDVYDEIAQAFEEARASGALEDGGSCVRYTCLLYTSGGALHQDRSAVCAADQLALLQLL